MQETFLRAFSWDKPFQSEEHEKAWLIVTASNLCKDALKRARRRDEPLEEHGELTAPQHSSEVLEAVLALPEDYKAAVYLYYYEGRSAKEIASLLNCPQAKSLPSHLIQKKPPNNGADVYNKHFQK